MLGLPIEVWVTLFTTVATWFMENSARKEAAKERQFELALQALKAEDASADAAVGRVPSWLRSVLALLVVGGVFVGILACAFTMFPVTLVTEVAQKHFLGIHWGDTLRAYELNGFVMAPVITNGFALVLGFTFGRTLGRGGRL